MVLRSMFPFMWVLFSQSCDSPASCHCNKWKKSCARRMRQSSQTGPGFYKHTAVLKMPALSSVTSCLQWQRLLQCLFSSNCEAANRCPEPRFPFIYCCLMGTKIIVKDLPTWQNATITLRVIPIGTSKGSRTILQKIQPQYIIYILLSVIALIVKEK